MATLDLKDAPALAEALAKATPGEEIVVVREGREVARILPAAPSVDDMIALIRAHRRPTALTPEELKALVDEGRL